MDATELSDLTDLARWIRDAGRVVVLTGAGVSTASGIPDYRGPQGVWTKDPAAERLSSIEPYLADAEVRRTVWKQRREQLESRRQPNPAHLALAELERQGRIHAIVTQNVDGLHQAAGSDPERVIEVHGTIHEVICLSCSDRGPASAVLERLASGEDDPRCVRCGGLLKSATISFGQSLDPAVLQRAHDAVVGCDVLLAVGSSLVVHPVALLPRTALEAGARLAVVNAESTPYDDRADVVVHADVGETLMALLDQVTA